MFSMCMALLLEACGVREIGSTVCRFNYLIFATKVFKIKFSCCKIKVR